MQVKGRFVLILATAKEQTMSADKIKQNAMAGEKSEQV
jgi:hypothetical protein